MSVRFAWPLALLACLECMLLFAALCGVAVALDGVESSRALLDGPAVRFLLICLLVSAMMFALGLYTWHAASSYGDLILRLLTAFLAAYLLYAAMAYAIDGLAVAPNVLHAAIPLVLPAILGLRVGFLRLSDQARLKSRIVVLGTGATAARLCALEGQGPLTRFVPVAFVALEAEPSRVPAERVCGMPQDLAGFARSQDADEIVIALEDRRGRLPVDALVQARLAGLRVSDYQGFSERALGRVDLAALKPNWFLSTEGFRSGRLHRLVKRALDVGVSLALLTASLPVILLTALAIKLESPGPVFYRQERVGLHARPFTLLKFRSMRNDAEKDGVAQWASVGDARVTRVGAVIRKTRIDEIPQAINVLLGQMSFVGPRPERPAFVEMLAREIPFYHERHSVKPGITGWAQINYPYGASVADAREKLQYDLYYVKNLTLVFDLAIVLQTVRVVLWSAGAR